MRHPVKHNSMMAVTSFYVV